MIDKEADLALMKATRNGKHADMESALFSFADPDTYDGEDTPLSAAIKRKDYVAMRILLNALADPNFNLDGDDDFDGRGATPLMLSVSDPAAFAVILAHTRYEPEIGRRNLNGKAFVDCIPLLKRSEIYSLLALLFAGEDKQLNELRAKADAAGQSVKRIGKTGAKPPTKKPATKKTPTIKKTTKAK